MKRRLDDFWRDAVLSKIPHGEEGCLQLSKEDAFKLCEILINGGYAVCLTGGDFDNNIEVRWIHAGTSEDTNWADYDEVAFFSVDYLEDYPQALEEELIKEESENSRNSWLKEEDYVD